MPLQIWPSDEERNNAFKYAIEIFEYMNKTKEEWSKDSDFANIELEDESVLLGVAMEMRNEKNKICEEFLSSIFQSPLYNIKNTELVWFLILLEESRVLARILRLNGFEVYSVACKTGAMLKTDIGLDPKYTCKSGNVMCNPILQAKLMNREKVDLNIVMGLCCGHDSLFYKYAEGLTTTLVVKDRVLGNNPVQVLYQTRSYYRRLLAKPVGEK